MTAQAKQERPQVVQDMIERLCREAEREQSEGNGRVADLLWQIAEDFEDHEWEPL